MFFDEKFNFTEILTEFEFDQILLHFNQSQKPSKTGSWEWNVQDDSIWWSDQVFELLDVDKTKFDVSYESYLSLLTDVSVKNVIFQVQKILKDGKPFEHFISLKSNLEKKLKCNGYLVKDKDGNNLKLLGTIQDVTDELYLKEANLKQQRVVNEKETQIKIAFENLPGILYRFFLTKDNKMGFSYVSEGIFNLMGYNPSEWVNPSTDLFISIIHPADLVNLQEKIIQSAKNLSKKIITFRVKCKCGTYKWMKTNSNPILKNNGDVEWDGIMIDVDREYFLQSKITESEENLRAVADNIDAMVTQFIVKNNIIKEIVFLSKGAEKLLGKKHALNYKKDPYYLFKHIYGFRRCKFNDEEYF